METGAAGLTTKELSLISLITYESVLADSQKTVGKEVSLGECGRAVRCDGDDFWRDGDKLGPGTRGSGMQSSWVVALLFSSDVHGLGSCRRKRLFHWLRHRRIADLCMKWTRGTLYVECSVCKLISSEVEVQGLLYTLELQVKTNFGLCLHLLGKYGLMLPCPKTFEVV